MSTTETSKVKLKNAPATPTPTAPAAVPVEPPVDSPRPPLEAALSRLTATRERDVQAALTIYRAHALALAEDKRLSGAEMDALAHAVGVLDLTADVLRSDVQAIREHRAQIGHAERAQQVASDLMRESEAWAAEEKQLRDRLTEIAQRRGRLNGAHQSVGSHRSAADRVASGNPRVLGTLAEAVAAATTPRGDHPYTPRVIRSGDGAPVKQEPVTPMPVPADYAAR
jgi:hypothetical protein